MWQDDMLRGKAAYIHYLRYVDEERSLMRKINELRNKSQIAKLNEQKRKIKEALDAAKGIEDYRVSSGRNRFEYDTFITQICAVNKHCMHLRGR